VTSMLALDHVGQRNVVLLAPSRDANLGALHGDYAVLHANRSNGVWKHLFYGRRRTETQTLVRIGWPDADAGGTDCLPISYGQRTFSSNSGNKLTRLFGAM
jgi:hypothetical protein